jgi:tRNA (guanine-N7-)-methyltransferase
MSAHQKEAYARLFDTYSVDTPFDSWDSIFPGCEGTRIVLDIGFGMGYELAELADRFRDTRFLGVEVHTPGVGKLLSEIERRNLENVRIAQMDAVLVCERLIPGASLDAVHVFFPDPWPKKRHHKRRLIRPGFPELIAPLMKAGAYLYTVTDWDDYAQQMLDVLESSDLFRNRYQRWAERQPWRPTTAFERKGLAKGHTIRELFYERTDVPGELPARERP